jgi:hypothetical protein
MVDDIFDTSRGHVAEQKSGLVLAGGVAGATNRKVGSSRSPISRERMFRRWRDGTRSAPSIRLPDERQREEGCLRCPARKGRCSSPL